MSVSAISSVSSLTPVSSLAPAKAAPSAEELEVREKFQEFTAGTFYAQMLKALRSTQGKPAYFHGGRAEEMFQGQMDQHLASELARSHGAPFVGPLFDAYQAQRK